MTDPLIVDVYQGDGPKDWPALAAAGAPWHGAILKATQGTYYRDTAWLAPNWRSLRQVAPERYGVDWFRGAYHYLDVRQGGLEQADAFLAAIDYAGGWGARYTPTLPVHVYERIAWDRAPSRYGSTAATVWGTWRATRWWRRAAGGWISRRWCCRAGSRRCGRSSGRRGRARREDAVRAAWRAVDGITDFRSVAAFRRPYRTMMSVALGRRPLAAVWPMPLTLIAGSPGRMPRALAMSVDLRTVVLRRTAVR
jgi:hypothetical protein